MAFSPTKGVYTCRLWLRLSINGDKACLWKSLKSTNSYIWFLRQSRWFSVITTLENYIETFLNSGHASLVLHYFAKSSMSSWKFITLLQTSAPQIKRYENKNDSSKKKVKLYPQFGVETHLQLSLKFKKDQKTVFHFVHLKYVSQP